MPKAPKLPACDPCRSSKLACDHVRPVCSRCRDRDRADTCTYRLRPFRRLRDKLPDFPELRSSTYALKHPRNCSMLMFARTSQTQPVISSCTSPADDSTIVLLASERRYPNPGYLGSSSHAALFGQLSMPNEGDNHENAAHAGQNEQFVSERVVNEVHVSHGAGLIENILNSMDISACVDLVKFWTLTGENLALAGSLTDQCAITAQLLFSETGTNKEDIAEISRKLFMNSTQTLVVDASTSLAGFCAQFCHQNARWETLGLFFAAVSRAAWKTIQPGALLKGRQQRHNLRKLAMHYSDRCLDISLSLDCLNDLSLTLQYENFIVHSIVDGDQSKSQYLLPASTSITVLRTVAGYPSWRKLGDVTSSLLALGYHQAIEGSTLIPPFLKEFRQTVFALAYSADKNMSIFLGRPWRIHRGDCLFQLPGVDAEQSRMCPYISLSWDCFTTLNFAVDTLWSTICATLKEDALNLKREERHDEKTRKGNTIQSTIESHWENLPARFRLEQPMKSYDRPPVELDFLVKTRLDYLHVLFVLRLALTRQIPEPDLQLVTISANMLDLVIEAVMNKVHLADSGTSLVWKVEYYGLAAAGVICLSLLHHPRVNEHYGLDLSKTFQNLNVLVAEVEMGTLVYLEEPNYALLAGATRTIKNLLGRFVRAAEGSGLLQKVSPNTIHCPPPVESGENWNPWGTGGLQDFEVDFWLNLAEHPFLNTASDAV